jgi:thiazole synthase
MNEQGTPIDTWTLAGRTWRSRLLVGTGKYRDAAQTKECLARAGAEIVTVALRRVDLAAKDNLLSWIDRDRYTLLPNTAGCFSADEAVRTLRLARELGIADLVKLEVIGDPHTLLPDNEQTIVAARQLVAEGFVVLPYCTDDPIVARKLEDVGCAAVMPLAAPIGSGRGLRDASNLELILAAARVPVIVDAGVGTPSHAARAMELGCAGVLMNTAIAAAADPPAMADAMRLAIEAGRRGFLAGPMAPRDRAHASSPTVGAVE